MASPTIKGSTDLLMLHLRGTELVEYSQLITVGFLAPKTLPTVTLKVKRKGGFGL